MPDRRKAVFLPVDNRILNLFKGYVLNGEPLFDINENDVYTVTEYYEPIDPSNSKKGRVIRIIILVLLAPISIFVLLIAAIFQRLDQMRDEIKRIFDRFFNIIFKKKKELRTRRIKKKEYNDLIEEDIPEFLNYCKKNFVNVYLYSYRELTIEDKSKVEHLTASSFILSCQIIPQLSDLISFASDQNISMRNSLLVILDSKEKKEANVLDFRTITGFEGRLQLWGKRPYISERGEGILERDSCETIIGMKKQIDLYLYAENNTLLSKDLILFIEDKQDTFLKCYIEKNLSKINKRLNKKQMRLLYFPSFQNEKANIPKPILEFLRYRLPVLYSLNDTELNETIQTILKKITVDEFYGFILEELQLPLFRRPCLLRCISGDFPDLTNKFKYKYIEYRTKTDLDQLFNSYIKQIRFPCLQEESMDCLLKPPSEYNADWNFSWESKQDTEELKQKIDKIKSEEKYGVLAEVIIYMLETIKDEKPEILKKVKPLIEKKKLLESKTILSPIVIDKHYKIFLPDFGNVEVKMHALPKTVYLLFLRYPKGIRFKELYQYKAELLEIYNKVTNKFEKDEIEKAIDDLVDMTNPSINQKCARIREAFRKIMDEHVAKYYYIDGPNGEPKKISLPKNLIDIRY